LQRTKTSSVVQNLCCAVDYFITTAWLQHEVPNRAISSQQSTYHQSFTIWG